VLEEDDIEDEKFKFDSPNSEFEIPVPAVQNRKSSVPHQAVLVKEVLGFLNVRPDGTYIDATLGAGGHAAKILEILEQGKGKLLGIDRDTTAADLARRRLAGHEERLNVQVGNFANIDVLHAASGLPPADGILADLGMSSMQVDDAARGFSFNLPGPLDMRMDSETTTTAEEIVNYAAEREMADLFFKLGEERHSRRIARAIVKARPIRSTTELAQVVTRAIPSRTGLHQIHPATRVFMALRLAVNYELESLEAFLAKVFGVMAAGGRLVILSFHSLEDRMVKRALVAAKEEGRVRILTKHVVRATEEEVRENPRSRSAKLRCAEII
jgi:16S rRNA (cytosine1402-N4)-methyltransferase